MSDPDRDNPEASSNLQQVVQNLRDARGDRAAEEPPQAPRGLGEDPMMSLKVRPRRKRCKYCRYRFDYRMHTNRCPECGRYRDDYPRPNHGLQAMLFASALVGAFCLLIVAVFVIRSL